MIRYVSRRDVLGTTAKLAVAASFAVDYAAVAHAEAAKPGNARTPSQLDVVLRAATRSGDLPGVVALAATDNGHRVRRRVRQPRGSARDSAPGRG